MSDELRPEVTAFARLMEAKLRENDGKGGWRHCTTAYLSRRCGNELEELRAAVTTFNRRYPPDQIVPIADADDYESHVTNIARESADVANFAMMLADVCGALRSSGIEAAGRAPLGDVTEDAKHSEPAHVAAPIEGLKPGQRCTKSRTHVFGLEKEHKFDEEHDAHLWGVVTASVGRCPYIQPPSLPTEPAKPACEICNDTGTDNGDGYARPCPNACKGPPTKPRGP